MPKDIIKITTVNEWLTYNQKLTGVTKKNIQYLCDYITIREELGKCNIVLYFLLNRLNVSYVITMLYSGIKQRKYVVSVIVALKQYKVEKKHEAIFNRDIDRLYKRIEHINRIIKEDIRLTEYGAFFEAVGYDLLTVEKLPTIAEIEEVGRGKTILDYLEQETTKWNAEHPNEVKAHLESIKPELDALARHKEEVKAKEKAERLAKREEKKALTREVNEIKKNKRAYEARQRRINRELDRYY